MKKVSEIRSHSLTPKRNDLTTFSTFFMLMISETNSLWCSNAGVLPLKSASFSISSPRSPVTGRACLTFRFVSLRKRKRKQEWMKFMDRQVNEGETERTGELEQSKLRNTGPHSLTVHTNVWRTNLGFIRIFLIEFFPTLQNEIEVFQTKWWQTLWRNVNTLLTECMTHLYYFQ